MSGIEVVIAAGLISGTLDLCASTALFRLQGVPPKRLLQTIASGALGPSALQGEAKTATAGLFFHFLIACTVTGIYYAFSRYWPSLNEHPISAGIAWGTAVHLVMSRVVLPLSRMPKREFSLKAFLIQLGIHILCVGLPITLAISHLSR